MASIINVRNIEAPTGGNLELKTNQTTRLTVSSAGVITATGNTAITGGLSSTTFNNFVPVNKAGDTITGNLNTPGITVGGNAVWHTGNSNRVINRGNPGSGNPLLLSEMDVAHFYNATNISIIDISTTMVEDAVYELYYSANTSANNIDIIIRPNYIDYAGQFQAYYWCTTGANSVLQFFDQTLPYFYFDHQNGSVGTTPSGRFVIYNFRSRKHVQYQGGDTLSAAIGTARWNNGTNQWINIGQLAGLASATDVRVMVRRIG
jgi:hypothetical protein